MTSPKKSTFPASWLAHNKWVTASTSFTLLLALMSAITLTLSPSAAAAASTSSSTAFIVPGAAPFASRLIRDHPLLLPSQDDHGESRLRLGVPLSLFSAVGASEYDDDAPPEQPPLTTVALPLHVPDTPLDAIFPETAVLPPLHWMPEDDENEYLGPVAGSTATATATSTAPRASLRAKLGLSVKNMNEKEAAAVSASSTRTSIKVVGHRGALYEFLENTREGFVHCAQLGCHAVELDVFVLPRDGSVVVFHGTDDDELRPGLLRDYCLGYDAASRHSIVDLTYEESQLLRFNPDFAEFGCHRSAVEKGHIPLLQDVLQDLQAFPDLQIKIELKGHGTVQPVLEIVECLQMQRQCSYSSFDLQQLRQLRQMRPDTTLYRTGALFAGVPPSNLLELANDCGATEIHLQYDECTTAWIAAIHQAGLGSMAWFRGPRGMQSDAVHKYSDDMRSGEDERCYETMLETGVQQVCCNRPNALLRLLTERQEQQTWTVG